jgi:hypothetical protein
MPRAVELWPRYRILAVALAISAAVHAAVVTGLPGRIGGGEADAQPSYAATLELAPAGAKVEQAPSPAAKPRKAARLPKPQPAGVLAVSSDALAAALPAEDYAPDTPSAEELAPPRPPAAPPPERVAMAQPAASVRALEAPKFPVAALPSRLSVTYSLTSAFADGTASYEWTRDGDRYRITSEAQAVGFFTLFLEGRIWQETEGAVTPAGLRPDRFLEHRPNAEDEGLEFDWTYDYVVLSHGGERSTAPITANSVDWLSMIFQLAAAPPASESFDLQVFTQRKLYKFHLRSLGIEEIDVPIGRLRARHLQHVDKESGEIVDVWVGIDQHNLPVKLRFPVARNRIMVEQVATDITER